MWFFFPDAPSLRASVEDERSWLMLKVVAPKRRLRRVWPFRRSLGREPRALQQTPDGL